MDLPVAGAVLLAALIWAFVDFLKNLRAADWNATVTQLIVWASGVAGVFLIGATQFAKDTHINGQVLTDLDGASKLVVGLLFSSLASGAYQVKKAVDSSDSAKQPPLVG